MRKLARALKGGVLASTLGVFGSALMWLLSFKGVAYWMGPEGVGLFSQFRQIAQAATVGATFGGTTSVVQGLSECKDETSRMQFRLMASRFIALTGGALTLAMLVLAPQLTRFFLASDAPELVASLRWLTLAVLLNICGTYALAVLNGYRAYPFLALAQIAGPLSLVMVLFGAWWLQFSADPQMLSGSFVLCFAVTCCVGWIGVSRLPRPLAAVSSEKMAVAQKYIFLKFATSNLLAALSTTLALLLIRSWVIGAKGLGFAGLFDAGWTLTFNYTTLFLTACSAVYLPLLTAANGPQIQRGYILKTAYLVLGASTLICYSMVLLKDPLIRLLYSSQFQASGDVLMVLVIAVIFRSISWVYGTLIVATRDSRVLLVSDLSLNILLLATTRYALQNYVSLEALSWAFVLPNFLYLIFVIEYACHKNKLMQRRQIWPFVVAGIAPLIYLAIVHSNTTLMMSNLIVWPFIGIGIAVSGAAFFAYTKVNL
jgi:O-antigen/teichoic acid export membrane protein